MKSAINIHPMILTLCYRSSKDFSVYGSVEDNPFDWKLLVSGTFQDATDVTDCAKPLLTFELAEVRQVCGEHIRLPGSRAGISRGGLSLSKTGGNH